MTFVEITVILLAHWLGDFLLQNQGMALNKSKSNAWLSLHVLTYSLGLLLVVAMLLVLNAGKLAFLWLFVNMVFHWWTDFLTSKWTAYLYSKKQFYRFPGFFDIVGLDQMLHYIALFGTYWMVVQRLY